MFVLSVKCGRRDIPLPEDKSWISDENFRTIVRSTFPSSVCCNVFLSDSMGDSKALFSQFRSIYPYEYLLKRSTYECDGYFLLGSSDNEIVEPVEKYEETRHENNINFRGRELQVCSIYRPPMTYLNHTIVETIDGEQAEVFVMDNATDWNGIETRLFLIMAEKLNFTWTIRKPEGGYTYGRRVNETLWKGGMIQMLREKKVYPGFRNFPITLIDLIGCLLSSSVPKIRVTNKLQTLLWQTAGWLIIAAYYSSLAARLSSSDYERRIDTVEQFLAANLSWGNMGQVPPFRDYFDLTNPYASQLPNKYCYIKNSAQLRRLIMDGNYAILGKIVGVRFFLDDYVSNDDLKNYRLMKQSVGNFYIMLCLKETGITIWHLRDVIRSRASYNLHEVLVEHDGYDGSVQVLGLTPLGAGFSLLLVGTSIATLVFYLELKRAAGSSSVRQFLREIDGKRGENE
ncbi:hypothetical protein WH47_03531 [Habropoda laboriosa]|uniref:Uncharacterized protein n=1 Tax=Habropoda laboriosa TaxID=597456 RepID=A0A0L7RC24_9HYME|nr:hypothetical protein WH47_03531 [Habropoda laboriosa]